MKLLRQRRRSRKTMTVILEIDTCSKLSFAFFDSGERKGIFLLDTADAVAIATGLALIVKEKMVEAKTE
jgi:hypothetical protein